MANFADNSLEKVVIIHLLDPAVYTGTQTSAAADTNGHTYAGFYIVYGATGDTLSASVSFECKLTESNDLAGTYTDVDSTDIDSTQATVVNNFGLIDANSEDSETYGLGYKGSKRYVKVVATVTGTHSNGIPFGIVAALGLPKSQTTGQKIDP